MRKWIQSALGGKEAPKNAHPRDCVGKALLQILEEKQKKSIIESAEREVQDRDIRHEPEIEVRDSLHELAARSTGGLESPWGTHTPSSTHWDAYAQHGSLGSAGDNSMATREVLFQAAYDDSGWTCGICNQKDNIGDNCSVCYRPRGAQLNRAYMTVTEITQDVVDGIKRQRDPHARTQPIRGSQTEVSWHARTPTAPKLQLSRTQPQWPEQPRDAGRTREALPRAGFSTAQKAATFHGSSKSTGSLPAASSTSREGINFGPAPALPSFSTLPDASTMSRSASLPPGARDAPAADSASRQSPSKREASLLVKSQPAAPPLPTAMHATPWDRTQASPSMSSASRAGADQGRTSIASNASLLMGRGEASRSPSGTPPMIKPGTSVSIRDLSAPQHPSGSCGTVRAWDRTSRRWIVDFPSGESKPIRPENVHPLATAAGIGSHRVPSPAGTASLLHGVSAASISPPALSSAARSALADPQSMSNPSAAAKPTLSNGVKEREQQSATGQWRRMSFDGSPEHTSSKDTPAGFPALSGTGPGTRCPTPGGRLAPLNRTSTTRDVAERTVTVEPRAAANQDVSGTSKALPFPPAKLQSPPQAPSNDPAFPRQPAPKREIPQVIEPMPPPKHSAQCPADGAERRNHSEQSIPKERSAAKPLGSQSIPSPMNNNSNVQQATRVQQSQSKSIAAQPRGAQATSTNVPSPAFADQDPMAMLMANMQNLNRLQNNLKTNFA